MLKEEFRAMKVKVSDLLKVFKVDGVPQRTFLESFIRLGIALGNKHAYTMYKLKKEFEKHIDEYNAYMQERAEFYGSKSGESWSIPKDKTLEFQQDLQACLDSDIEINFPDIDVKVEELEIDMIDFELLEPLMNSK